MQLKENELKFLISKYKKEGLKDKQIYNRLHDIFDFQKFITFKKKYL